MLHKGWDQCFWHYALGIQVCSSHQYQQDLPSCCSWWWCQTTCHQKAISSFFPSSSIHPLYCKITTFKTKQWSIIFFFLTAKYTKGDDGYETMRDGRDRLLECLLDNKDWTMDFGLYLINEASHDESNSKISTLSHPLDTSYVPFPAREISTTHNETNWWIRFDILNEHLTRACWSWYEQQILYIIKSSIIEHLFDLFQSFVELDFKLSIASVNRSRLIQHEYLWFQIIHASFIHGRIDIPIFFIVSHSMNCLNT